MTHDDNQAQECDHDPGAELSRCARQAEDAVRRLAHLSISRPSLTPAEVDTVLSHLAETLAALPQVATQLADILDQTRDTHRLAMDDMTATTDPDLALDTARLHLEELREPAARTYQRLNAARNEVAHISATPLPDHLYTVEAPEPGDRHRRREHRQPPPAAGPALRGPAR